LAAVLVLQRSKNVSEVYVRLKKGI
jgi:hypothetical protein